MAFKTSFRVRPHLSFETKSHQLRTAGGLTLHYQAACVFPAIEKVLSPLLFHLKSSAESNISALCSCSAFERLCSHAFLHAQRFQPQLSICYPSDTAAHRRGTN